VKKEGVAMPRWGSERTIQKFLKLLRERPEGISSEDAVRLLGVSLQTLSTYAGLLREEGYIIFNQPYRLGSDQDLKPEVKPKRFNPHYVSRPEGSDFWANPITGWKRCTKCKALKDVDLFDGSTSQRDGYSSRCKECVHGAQTRTYEERRMKFARVDPVTGLRLCLACKRKLDVDFFSSEHSPYCINCAPLRTWIVPDEPKVPDKIAREGRRRRREPKIDPVTGLARCACCKQRKSLDHYGKDKHSPAGIKSWCNECLKIYRDSRG
jgi:hypothetical protein